MPPYIEKRSPFSIDEAKFFTQKVVTFAILLIFAGTVATVLYQADQSERSMILQTVINLTLLAVGYWIGASKGAADSNDVIGKIAKGAPAVSAAAVAAATGAPVAIQANDVQVNQPEKP